MSIFSLFVLILINLNEHETMLLRGKRAHEGQFPWLLQFQTILPCGGVLLSSDWVLTAAQCVQESRNSIILFATGLNGTRSKQTVLVKATYIYPDYDAYSISPDRGQNIALLKLIEPFNICDARIILPRVVPVSYDANYTSCFIFGWQSYVSPSLKVFAKPIQYNEVIVNSWKLCTYMIKTNANHTNVFCTMVEFKDEMKTCAGNPGSPVVCENRYREIAVLGIASWTNFSLECGDFSTYIDLNIFRMWIYDLILDNKTQKLYGDNKLNNFERTINIKQSTISWNNESHLQSNYPSQNTNMSYFWNKLYTRLSIENDTTISIPYDYHHKNYTNILKESSNNIYRYKDIGKNFHDQLGRNMRRKHLINSNRYSLHNGNKFDTTLELNDDTTEFSSFEFLLPFNFEDLITSCSNITVISNNVYFLIYILLLLWYYHLYETHYF